jgi:hypothetical protein
MRNGQLTQETIGQHRLVSQQIASPTFSDPGEVVRWLGAVQAQDYLAALWAVGLRTVGATEQVLERALAERRIVRTWPMRGTIHFVAPVDVRWMLELLTPRVVQRSQSRLRQLGLDAATLTASAQVVTRALEGGRRLTRPALYRALAADGIAADGARGLHILGQLAQARLICFGPHDGKQPTFVLLDEWVPPAPALSRDEALATLALRYFTSHGPATVHDFVWWSGLTVAEAKAGLGAVAAQLAHATLDGQTYYWADEDAPNAGDEAGGFLLPSFDEFLVGYRDRSAVLDPARTTAVVPGGNGMFNPIAVSSSRVVGTWKRVIKPRHVVVAFSPFAPWSDSQVQAFQAAAERYGRFLGLPVVVEAR